MLCPRTFSVPACVRYMGNVSDIYRYIICLLAMISFSFENIQAIVCPDARCEVKIHCLLSCSIKLQLLDNIQFLETKKFYTDLERHLLLFIVIVIDMGANNCKPQTVQMSNNSPFQISREVLDRVEKAANADNADKAASSADAAGADTDGGARAGPSTVPICENCQRIKAGGGVRAMNLNSMSEADGNSDGMQDPSLGPGMSVSKANMWQRRSTEVEEMQFNKTLGRVQNLFGQPVKWVKANNCSSDVESMEKELIACYQEYKSEPLKCAALVKQYQGFIFKKQVAAVENSKPRLQNLDGSN